MIFELTGEARRRHHETAGARLCMAVSAASSIPELQESITALEREFDIKFDADLREHAISSFEMGKRIWDEYEASKKGVI